MAAAGKTRSFYRYGTGRGGFENTGWWSAARFVATCVVCLSCGCDSPSTRFLPPAPSPARPAPNVPPPPAVGDGINGQYRGDLSFTEEDKSYGWPAHIMVVANLLQSGADVSGDFDLLNVIHSGGFVKGTIETGDGGNAPDAFRADFWPDDLGDHFTIDTNIVAPDGSQFAGTFIFAEGIVGRGNATFTRVK